MAAVYFSGKGVVYSRASSGTMINNTGDGMAEEEYLGQRQLASSEPEHLLWMAWGDGVTSEPAGQLPPLSIFYSIFFRFSFPSGSSFLEPFSPLPPRVCFPPPYVFSILIVFLILLY